jgi:hypothetical protein
MPDVDRGLRSSVPTESLFEMRIYRLAGFYSPYCMGTSYIRWFLDMLR